MNFSKKNHELIKSNRKAVSKALYLIITLLFISVFSNAQNGINYKALIKDANGNVVANDLIQVEFNILQGAAQTNVYSETHTPTTDVNGVIIVQIGEGTTTDVFTDINWRNNEHYLNVQINTGSGFVDLGTTQFETVPYAKVAENVNGLEALDEGNGIGWRMIGKNPDSYGNIGEHAIDFSAQGSFNNRGATGQFSFAAGAVTIANAPYSVAFGEGSGSTGSASFSTGRFSFASGDYSTAMGQSTDASGYNSTALGRDTQAEAYLSTAIGRYNVGGGSATEWLVNEPLFEIGNGTSNSNRSNALTVYKNGALEINSIATGLIINGPQFYGIYISNTGQSGINVASASIYGGSFRGNLAGIYADATNNTNPDIILGGDSGNANDDGIIASDPNLSGSDIYLRSNDAVVIELDHNASSTNSSFQVQDSAGDAVFRVFESGNATLAGNLTQNSDRRLKQDITDLPYGLNEILQLQPKHYFWKHKEQDKKSLGLIAQDVQPIINEIVNVQDDEAKTLGISYTELIPVLIKAIQEQQKIIETQNNKIEIIEQKLTAFLEINNNLSTNSTTKIKSNK